MKTITIFPWYELDVKNKVIYWKKWEPMKPNELLNRVTLYLKWKRRYFTINKLIDLATWKVNTDDNEMVKHFKEKWKDKIRRDTLRKHFEHFFIDECVEEWIIIETKEKWHKFYSLTN